MTPEGEEDDITSKRFKRFRSRHVNTIQRQQKERFKLQEMIFLRDLHFGFLPDDCEVEFAECLAKLADDVKFASKCFRLALLSRNEDLVRYLLDHLVVTRDNFQQINATFLDSLLLLEAVELDDLESIQSVLAWRDAKGSQVGLTPLDKKLLKLQKPAQDVMVAAAVKNNYSVIKILYADGYKINDAAETNANKRFFRKSLFRRNTSLLNHEDMMESHIERIRKFKAMASPAYMAMTYVKDPVEHAFDFTKRAGVGMIREPEFKSEYEAVRAKCSSFAVSILNSCHNSSEVEQVLHGTGIDRPYARLYRALREDQKDFVSHPYCQVLLHSKWLNGADWTSHYFHGKILHVFFVVLFSPILCPLYAMSPYRDHGHIGNPLGWVLRQMDRPINRYILDMASYGFFLTFLLLSVIFGIGDHKNKQRTWYFNLTMLWVFCYTTKLVSDTFQAFFGRITLNKFRYGFDLLTIITFIIAIGFKVYGYEVAIKDLTGGLLLDRTEVLNVNHPINIGANIYGAAACMAFLKVIFLFEIHSRFGPILFCIKNVFWDIMSIILSFVITVFAFGVGLVSVFGIYEDDATKFSDFTSAFKTLFWIIFDPGKEEYADIIREEATKEPCCCNDAATTPSSAGGSSIARPIPRPGRPGSFATIRPPDDDGDQLTHGFGIYIWAFYQVFVVLIMLNLLISLMTTTFSKIQRNADSEWKFSRASIWIHYYDDLNSIPPPFNIIPSVYSIRRLISWCAGRGDKKTWTSSLLICQESKRKLYDTLIERVFRSEEKKQDAKVGRSDIENLEKEIAIDISDLRRDLRNLRRDLGLPVKKSLGPPNRGLTVPRKLTHPFKIETMSLDEALHPPHQRVIPKRRQTSKSFSLEDFPKSFKVDNDPEVVKNLVQTLGLIGLSTSSLEKASKPNTPTRHNSLV